MDRFIDNQAELGSEEEEDYNEEAEMSDAPAKKTNGANGQTFDDSSEEEEDDDEARIRAVSSRKRDSSVFRVLIVQ